MINPKQQIISATSCFTISLAFTWNPMTATALALSNLVADFFIEKCPSLTSSPQNIFQDLEAKITEKLSTRFSQTPLVKNLIDRGLHQSVANIIISALTTAFIASNFIPFISISWPKAALFTVPAIFTGRAVDWLSLKIEPMFNRLTANS